MSQSPPPIASRPAPAPPDRRPAAAPGAGAAVKNRVQIGVLVATLAVGFQFYLFVSQSAGEGAVTVDRPPGVEGFLPIGALMGWKLLAVSGAWDPVHPAAMAILGFAALISLALRKAFCGWFCPMGTVSEWAWRWGERILGKNYRLPRWLDVPLRGLKYLLLGFFAWAISTMGETAILEFLESPYYKVSDVKMLFFFTRMTPTTAVVLSFLTLASLFVRNFWCRYLCPYGALTGLLAMVGPTRIERCEKRCIGCGECARRCPAHLPVDRGRRVHSPECSGCMDCVNVCPAAGALEMKTAGFGRRPWSATALGMAVCLIFAAVVVSARITGTWHSRVPAAEFRALLKNIDAPHITHPGMSRRPGPPPDRIRD